MGNEQENKVGMVNETGAVHLRKKWNAPQLTAVAIAELTETMLNPGSDGVATSSLS